MIHLLINPCAGRGKGEKIGSLVEKALTESGIPFLKSVTAYAGHAPNIVRQALQNGSEMILAVGGDGTVGEVAQALAGTDSILGIIPAGTGNDYIKTLGVPEKWRDALDVALNGESEKVDAMLLNDHICMNIASIGLDACTAYYANRCRFFRGQLAYIYGLIRALFVAKLPSFTYSIDDGPAEHTSCTLAVFANGQYYGGLFRPVPVARHNDGIMDVLFTDKLSRLRMIPLIIGYARGRHVGWDVCHFYRCHSIHIKSDNGYMILNVDGDILTVDHLDIRLITKCVRVAVPGKGAHPHA